MNVRLDQYFGNETSEGSAKEMMISLAQTVGSVTFFYSRRMAKDNIL